MTITIREEIEKYLTAMTEIVTEYGSDYVYVRPTHDGGYNGGCRYEWADEPSCLIGKVLFKLGASLEMLRRLDADCGSIINLQSGGYSDLLAELGIVHRDTTVRVLQAAQTVQDSNGTWGQALEDAKEVAESILSHNS
jgi:hypothetical protein